MEPLNFEKIKRLQELADQFGFHKSSNFNYALFISLCEESGDLLAIEFAKEFEPIHRQVVAFKRKWGEVYSE
jgi:hypothetical protein